LIFKDGDYGEFIGSFIVYDEESKFCFPEALCNDIISNKILFLPPQSKIEPEPKIEKTSVKKSALPDKAKDTVDAKEKQIRELKHQLDTAQQQLEETQGELSKLKKNQKKESRAKLWDEFLIRKYGKKVPKKITDEDWSEFIKETESEINQKSY
jgi:ATP-dependent Clp protease ATP-binding subunit ClpA